MRRKNPEVIASTFIPGTQLLRPTIDCVFKRMMQNNPVAIQSLLTAVLQPKSPIESVKVLNPELLGPRFSSKGSRLDLQYSDRRSNEFKIILFLHHFLSEDDHKWLQRFAGHSVTADEAKVLVYARATGAVDNAACRDFCGLDTLSASLVLRRLRDRRLLEKRGSGRQTYYCLLGSEPSLAVGSSASKSLSETELTNQPLDSGYSAEHATLEPEHATLEPEHATLEPEHATLEPEHATFQSTRGRRVDTESLRQSICQLCAQNPQTVEQLAEALGRSRNYLRNKHLIPMVREGLLRFLYPESAKHPHQAYVTNKNVGQDRQ